MNHHSALIIYDDAAMPAVCAARAIPPLSEEQTRELRRCCFLDMVQRYATFPSAQTMAYAATDELRAEVQRDIPTMTAYRQEGSSSGERIINAFDDTFNAGFRHVLLLFGSAVWLSPRVVENGCALLNTHEDVLVVAPTVRGSYALIGMRYPQADILRLIDTHPARLYEETMRALSTRDTALFVLSTIPELAATEDLFRLWSEQQQEAGSATLPRTRDVLRGAAPSFTRADDF